MKTQETKRQYKSKSAKGEYWYDLENQRRVTEKFLKKYDVRRVPISNSL